MNSKQTRATGTHILVKFNKTSNHALVFLKKSINVLASRCDIKLVGTSQFPSDYTANQIKEIGLDIGLTYPVKRFIQALSEGIKKGLDALGSG